MADVTAGRSPLFGGASKALMAWAVVLAGTAALPIPCVAAPITYRYTGSVTTGFLALPLIPVGTPVTFTLTADPANPLNIPGLPPYLASYLVTLNVQLAGLNYIVSGALEVNGDVFDPANPLVPASGFVNLREFSTTGPALSTFVPAPCLITFTTGCFEFNAATTDPTSSALLLPYPTFSFPIEFLDFSDLPPSRGKVYITGSNPQAVPEPAALALMGAGLFSVRMRQRWGRRTPKA